MTAGKQVLDGPGNNDDARIDIAFLQLPCCSAERALLRAASAPVERWPIMLCTGCGTRSCFTNKNGPHQAGHFRIGSGQIRIWLRG